ncbi:hypothetical protein JTE90_002782 [Oedothorax gibbosus]|uniref:GON-4-like protein n=1 Tax=Oedothorax gibbosus TaxID=931172 RepID=A0AAV6UHQ8_9ARAC|nr:hypothetical protein JTE90_002782 [Oedothorax gibbosus]
MTDNDAEQCFLDDKASTGTIKKDFQSPSSNKKRKRNKTPVKPKKVLIEDVEETEACCSAETVENVLEDMEEEIDSALEQPCFKDKLTPTNVKSILRHIIANEYVLTMVRSTMKTNEEGELSDIEYEPKLTRSKAKEMRKQQCSLPWPVASPAKTVQKVSKKLLEEEFPDESSGDEDYKPEEECPSEDEARVSEAGTPRSRRSSLPSSPVSKVTDIPSEDENALVIALPDSEKQPSEADKIALRTRSKLCLNDTPLEKIEASFVAPDITMDLYEAHCDDEDWQSFLSELYQPIDTSATHDDAENDPEYKAVEEETPDYEDLCYEQVTTDEWNDLMLGTYELAQEDLSFLDDEDEEGEPREEVVFPENIAPPEIVETVLSKWMTSDERLQLDEQMRMYVQLLTQSHLLSHGNPALENLKLSTKIFLEELKMFATRERASEEKSAFYAQNLDGALDIVEKFEDINLPLEVTVAKETKKHLPYVPSYLKKTLATSKVFIYPELLPACGFQSSVELSKRFNTPEDNLITLGLEQFLCIKDPVDYIHKYLIPVKSVERIKSRIKNVRIKKFPLSNSIKYFQKFKEVPKFQKVIRIFDPDHIKAPEDYSPNFLPKWMESFSKLYSASRQDPPPKKDTSPQVLKPRKYVPILPRGLYFTQVPSVAPTVDKDSPVKSPAPSICDSETPYEPPLPRSARKNSCSKGKTQPSLDSKDETVEWESDGQKKVFDGIAEDVQNEASLESPVRRSKRLKERQASSQKTQQFLCNLSFNNKEFSRSQSDDQEVNDSEGSTQYDSCFKGEALQEVSEETSQCESDTQDGIDVFDDAVAKLEVIDAAFDESSECESDVKTEVLGEVSHCESETLDAMVFEEHKNIAGSVGKALPPGNLKAKWTPRIEVQSSDGSHDEQESPDVRFKKRKQRTLKRHCRKPRDLNTSLALLHSSAEKEFPKKAEREVMFANTYLLRATEILKEDAEVYEKFLSTLCKYHLSSKSPVELYSELKDILKDYPALVRDFLVFLRPEQAKQCGKHQEHAALGKVREFFRKIELYFKDQPEHIDEILRRFAQLQKQVDLTSAEVINTLRPLLKDQPHLFKELNDLLSSS